jgi:hypothetical protein
VLQVVLRLLLVPVVRMRLLLQQRRHPVGLRAAAAAG